MHRILYCLSFVSLLAMCWRDLQRHEVCCHAAPRSSLDVLWRSTVLFRLGLDDSLTLSSCLHVICLLLLVSFRSVSYFGNPNLAPRYTVTPSQLYTHPYRPTSYRSWRGLFFDINVDENRMSIFNVTFHILALNYF